MEARGEDSWKYKSLVEGVSDGSEAVWIEKQ